MTRERCYPRRKLETYEGADLLGIAAAIGVVATRGDVAPVVEQRINHMQCFARCCRDQLAVKGP